MFGLRLNLRLGVTFASGNPAPVLVAEAEDEGIAIDGLSETATQYTLTIDGVDYVVLKSALDLGPVNIIAPVVSGSTLIGSVLSSTVGVWVGLAGSDITYAYQWTRDSADIGSATAADYTLVTGDALGQIRCEITATNAQGAGTPALSNAALCIPPDMIGYWDISRSALWQDTGATIPADAATEPIYRVDNLAGFAPQLNVTADARRPLRVEPGAGLILADFDGVDDGFETPSTVDLSAYAAITVIWAGSTTNGTSPGQCLVETSADSGSNAGTFAILQPSGAAQMLARSRGTVGVTPSGTYNTALAANAVLTQEAVIATDTMTVRENGVQRINDADDQGTGNYGNHKIYVGARNNGSLRYTGNLGALIIIGGSVSTALRARLETVAGARIGVVL